MEIKMKFKASLLAAAVAFSLVGCGGDSNDLISTPNYLKTIKVIDGYLSQAEICVDKNENSLCDSGESIGVTNAIGAINLKESDLGYPIIAKIIPGKTQDSDRIGIAQKAYVMIASKDQTVITPFTTLANSQGITMDELASDLNLNPDLISDDYIAKKNQEETKNDAIKVHALARSIVSSLPKTIDLIDQAQITTTIEKATIKINEAENSNTLNTLDKTTIVVHENGDVSEDHLISNLLEHLESKDVWQLASFNQYYSSMEGVQDIKFKDGMVTIRDMKMPYTVDGNKLTTVFEGESESDEFIFTSKRLNLSVDPIINDLLFYYDANLDILPISTKTFVGKTLYSVTDDSVSAKPLPLLSEMIFKENSVLLLTQNGEQEKAKWNVLGNDLVITFLDTVSHETMTSNLVVEEINGIMLLQHNSDKGRPSYNFVTRSKEQAETIMARWTQAANN